MLEKILETGKYKAKPIHPDMRVQVYKQALSIDPGCDYALKALGDLYLDRNDLKNALDMFFELVQKQQDNKEALEKINQIVGQTFKQAFMHHKNQQIDEAEPGYRSILKVYPSHPDALHMLGLIEFDRKNYNDALSLIKKSLEVVPEINLQWLLNYGRVLRKTNNPEKALNIFQNALSMDPQSSVAKENIGDIYYELGNYRKALDVYDKILSVCGNKPQIGVMYIKTQKAIAQQEGAGSLMKWISENDRETGPVKQEETETK